VTGAGDLLQIEAAGGDQLSKPERRSVSKLPFGRALCSIGFWCVEPDESEGLASDPNCVAVDQVNLTGLDRRGVRHFRRQEQRSYTG
jgi:hypothetical protein